MQTIYSNHHVISIDVRTRSFGFVVFCGSARLLDWGVKSFRRGVNSVKISPQRKIAALLDDFSPQMILVRNCRSQGFKKRAEMLRIISAAATTRKIPLHFISCEAIINAFPKHGRNKHEIALNVARHFHELGSNPPRRRKLWEGEDYRMSIFDAAAAGYAHFSGRDAGMQSISMAA